MPRMLAISNARPFHNTLMYGQAQWNTISFAERAIASFGDTPYNNYFSSHGAGNSALAARVWHAWHGRGPVAGQAVQVNQNFTGDNNHMRADMCAFRAVASIIRTSTISGITTAPSAAILASRCWR